MNLIFCNSLPCLVLQVERKVEFRDVVGPAVKDKFRATCTLAGEDEMRVPKVNSGVSVLGHRTEHECSDCKRLSHRSSGRNVVQPNTVLNQVARRMVVRA